MRLLLIALYKYPYLLTYLRYMIDREVHNDLREMMTRQVSNTAADRLRCPSRNAIISSPLSGDVFTVDC